MRKVALTIAALGAAAMATPAAASETIYFDSDHSGHWGEGYAKGQALSFSNGGVTVSATGWTIRGGTIDTAKLGVWPDGLGVRGYRDGRFDNFSDSSHTVDNRGSLDFLILEFDQIVALETARLMTGWYDDSGNYINDTDATVGYLLGAMPLLDGQFMSALDGWDPSHLGEVGNSGDKTRLINPDGNAGNLWLIAASFDNPDKAITTTYKCGHKKKKTCTSTTPPKYDGFKLEYVTYSVPPPAVPEPSTWLMMILGFGFVGGVMRARRREKLTVRYS